MGSNSKRLPAISPMIAPNIESVFICYYGYMDLNQITAFPSAL